MRIVRLVNRFHQGIHRLAGKRVAVQAAPLGHPAAGLEQEHNPPAALRQVKINHTVGKAPGNIQHTAGQLFPVRNPFAGKHGNNPVFSPAAPFRKHSSVL